MKDVLPPYLRCWVEVDGSALRHNLQEIRRRIPQKTAVIAVVKANAYGHGALPVVRCCQEEGVAWFAVADVAEGIQLRKAGVKERILVLGASLLEEREAAIDHQLISTLSSVEEAQELASLAQKKGKALAEVHLKIDTGMGRLGQWHKDAVGAIGPILGMPGLQVTGLYTHYASSDEDEVLTEQQTQYFLQVCRSFPHLFAHLDNSHGVLSPKGEPADGVRAGILLYGLAHTKEASSSFRPALCWKSRVILLRQVPAGRTISYGATYRLPQAQTLATLSVGYADGYHWRLSNQGYVLVQGKRCPIRGRVTMDLLVVDVSEVADQVRRGDEVVLIGQQGEECIHASEVAKWAGTIDYEVLTSIHSNLPRLYLDSV